MIYATTSNVGDWIEPNAYIEAFDTVEAAHAYLMEVYANGYWNLETAVIAPGEFGDYWIRLDRDPATHESELSPFSLAQVNVHEPDSQHAEWWATPLEPVLVVTQIQPLRKP